MSSHPRDEAAVLAARRVPCLFGVPGSGPSYDLLDACEQAGVPFVLTAHEGAAVMMAGAGAHVTGAPGAALAIKGPGVANLVGGLALARFEQQPVVAFAEAYAPQAPAAQQHKRMPQDAALATVTKRVAYRQAGGAVLPGLLDDAVSSIPGPVHLNLVEGLGGFTAPEAAAPGTDADVAAALDRIALAERPILVLGASVARLVRDGRVSLEGLQMPVFTTAAAKGAFDERQPTAAGVLTCAGGPLAPETSIVPKADLVIGLGLKNLEVLGAKPFAAPTVLVDDVAGHADGFGAETCVVPASFVDTITAVVERLRARAWGADLVAEADRRLRASLESADFLPAEAFQSLQAVADARRARLVTDSGNFTVVAEHVWRATRPDEFLGSSIGRYMGVALPQALGVAIASPGRPVICTTGDGGLPPFLAEARLAAERSLPLLLVLITDGHFGSMRAKVEARQLSRAGIDVAPTRWRQTFDALGWASAHAANAQAFHDVVSGWNGVSPLMVEATMAADPYVSSVVPLR